MSDEQYARLFRIAGGHTSRVLRDAALLQRGLVELVDENTVKITQAGIVRLRSRLNDMEAGLA